MKNVIRRILSVMLATVMLTSSLQLPTIATEDTNGATIEYRYRDKEYTNSKTALEDPWLLYGTTTETTHDDYEYIYISRSLGGTDSGYTSDQADSWKQTNSSTYCFHGSKTAVCRYDLKTGYNVGDKTIYLTEGSADPDYTKYYFAGNYWRFMYCTTKTPYTLYKYYKWGEWSEWSETPVEGSDDREVETRSVYPSYTVTYDANGGTGAPPAQVKEHDVDLILSDTIPIREGYEFLGWSTSATGSVEYTSGTLYTLNANKTLYAVWQENTNVVASGVCGEDLTWTLYDNGVLLISGTGAMYDWSNCNETPWWSYRDQIETVMIEDGCTTIGSHAFAILSGITPYAITTVILPNTLQAINDRAFSMCTSITEISISDNVETIGDNAFYKCTGLKALDLGENLKTIGDNAFYACTSLTSIELNTNLETIGWYTFACCDSVEYIEIQENVKNIGQEAFISCDKLKKITVHPNNPYFVNDDNGVLYDTVNHILIQYPNGSLTTSYVIDGTTIEIARSAFSGCYNLQEVYLPKSLSTIDAYNFTNGVHQQIQTMYYAGTSAEWEANITVKKPAVNENAMSYHVLFNNGAIEYVITYNKNGSNYLESIPSQIKVHDVDLTLTSEKFTRTGYRFKGWSTTPDGDVEYLPASLYAANANITLYAVWEMCTYTVSYDANGGMNAPSTQIKKYDAALTLSNTVPTRENFDFCGWATTADGGVEYLPGETYSKNADITLFAVWSTHVHNWDSGTITTQPTHTTFGERTYTCQGCSASKTEQIDKTISHSYGSWAKVDDETHQRICVCGGVETDTHNWNGGTITSQPTHTTFGERTYVCQDCLATKTEQIDKTTSHSYGSWMKVDDETHKRICSCGDIETSTHNWDSGTVTTQPTHTTFGERTYTCRDCSTTKIAQVDKTTGHSYGSWMNVDDGTHKRSCVCGSVETSTHNWDTGTITTQPTHTTFGERTYTCMDCSATKTGQVDKTTQHSFGSWIKVDTEIHKRACVCGSAETGTHNWDGGTITTQPTHTTFGERTHTCLDCLATKTEQVDKTTQHSFGSWVKVDTVIHKRTCVCGSAETDTHTWDSGTITTQPTHTAFGTCTYTCQECSATKTEQVDKTTQHSYGRWNRLNEELHQRLCSCGAAETESHNWTGAITDAPTCSKEGSAVLICVDCYESKEETLPTNDNHTVVIDPAVASTCTTTGLTEGEHCSACSKVITAQTTIPELGHTEVVDAAVEPTCTATGLTEGKHCSVCGEVITAQTTIPELGHTEVVDAAVAPTCTATGLTEGKHCSACGEVILAQTTIPEVGHTEVVDAAVEPTCTAIGLTEGKHCSVCSEVIVAQTTIPELGHTEVIDAAVAPTCTATGLTEGKHCSVCSEVIVAQTTVPELGHTEVVDVAVEPTCTATGLTEGKHCSVCGEVITAQTTIPESGHTEFVDAAVAPTCTATGLTEGKHCSVCSEVIVAQTTIPELGHTEVIDAAVAPTCTATGLTEGKHCSVCSEVIVAQTTIPELGHTEIVDAAVAPTCTATGLTEGSHCLVCSEILISQSVIPQLGHIEEKDDMKCDRCSISLFTVKASLTTDHSQVIIDIENLCNIQAQLLVAFYDECDRFMGVVITMPNAQSVTVPENMSGFTTCTVFVLDLSYKPLCPQIPVLEK